MKADHKAAAAAKKKALAEKADAKEADTYHCYMQISDQILDAALARCGPGGVFMSARTFQKTKDPRFRTIHLKESSFKESCAIIAKCPGALGLVYTTQGFHVRVRSNSFVRAHRHLFPDEDVSDSDQGETSSDFHLKNVTSNVLRDDLTAALRHTGWNARAIRLLGPSAWLVRSEDDPEYSTLTLGRNKVVITKVTKPSLNQPVRTGTIPTASVPLTPSLRGRTSAQDWLGSRHRSTSPSAVPATTQGPQAVSIAEMESKMNAALQQQSVAHCEQLRLVQQASDAKVSALEAAFESLRVQNEEAVKTVENRLTDTIAQSAQQSRDLVQHGIAEAENRITTSLSSSISSLQQATSEQSSATQEAFMKQLQAMQQMMQSSMATIQQEVSLIKKRPADPSPDEPRARVQKASES